MKVEYTPPKGEKEHGGQLRLITETQCEAFNLGRLTKAMMIDDVAWDAYSVDSVDDVIGVTFLLHK